jgi:hypothetical protein
MALSTSDPAYQAEVIPASISAMGPALCGAYGVGSAAFGSKGNTAHTSGYHRSRQWVLQSPDSRYGSSDYSVTQTPDKSGDWRWISAFDFTPGVWGSPDNRTKMQQITARVHAAAVARDPRLWSLREFAGTLDGRTVVTFNCADGSFKAPFDSSHLDHCHGSFWRNSASNDHSSVIDVILGVPTGEDMDLSEIGGIVPGLSNAQALRDIWIWAATTRGLVTADADGIPQPRTDDRFHDATSNGKLVSLIKSGGGSLEVAAILEAMDAHVADLKRELRDAVADLGEGGAVQVRADVDAD